jgi:hypothetical protein
VGSVIAVAYLGAFLAAERLVAVRELHYELVRVGSLGRLGGWRALLCALGFRSWGVVTMQWVSLLPIEPLDIAGSTWLAAPSMLGS